MVLRSCVEIRRMSAYQLHPTPQGVWRQYRLGLRLGDGSSADATAGRCLVPARGLLPKAWSLLRQ
ncbi:hypothetical protein HaLaN_18827, partial [Haematococcus lacustris]